MRRLVRPGAAALLAAFALLIVSLAASPCAAEPIVLQSGAVDPEWNGWTAHGLGNGMAAGPTFDDQGLESWFISDESSGPGSTLDYRRAVDPADVALAHTLGWVLRAEVRLPLYADDVADAGSTVFEFADGERAYRVALGTETDGDPLIDLFGLPGPAGAPQATPDPPHSIYHVYELRYSPSRGLADLWVDGALWAHDYAGYASTDSHVLFGSTSDSDTGIGIWHRVEWSVIPVPEPSGLRQMLAALATLVVLRGLAKIFFAR